MEDYEIRIIFNDNYIVLKPGKSRIKSKRIIALFGTQYAFKTCEF